MRFTWSNTVWETALMLGVLLTLGLLLREADPLWLEVHPHPFWAVVLLIAVRYGNPAGFWTGLACAGLHVIGLSAGGTGLIEAFHLDATILITPLLYIAVGAFVGERIGGEQRRNEFYQKQLDEARAALDKSEGHRNRLEEAYRKLEGRLAGETDTITQFFQNARQLEAGGVEEIRGNLLRALEDCLGVEEADLWVRRDDGAWRSHRSKENTLPELGRIALRENRVVTAREFFAGQTHTPAAGLLAGPLAWADRGVDGIVVVSRMPFARFTRRAVMLFEVLLDWGARVLERQMLLETVSRRDVFDRDLGLTSEVFFRTSAAKVCQQARRRDEPCTLLSLHLDGKMRPAVRRRIHVVFAVILLRTLRASDIAAYARRQEAFLIFLPSTHAEQAAAVQGKLENAASRLHIDETLKAENGRLAFQTVEVDASETVDDAIARLLAPGGEASS